jgi:hypothetical protein
MNRGRNAQLLTKPLPLLGSMAKKTKPRDKISSMTYFKIITGMFFISTSSVFCFEDISARASSPRLYQSVLQNTLKDPHVSNKSGTGPAPLILSKNISMWPKEIATYTYSNLPNPETTLLFSSVLYRLKALSDPMDTFDDSIKQALENHMTNSLYLIKTLPSKDITFTFIDHLLERLNTYESLRDLLME